MKPYFTRVTVQMRDEARDMIIHPCCTDPCCVKPEDQITDALDAGIEYGIRYAMKMIAYRIRAELVCCTGDQIDAMAGKSDADGFHHICYWGEMGARLAEDPHSMLESPYECDGRHPGECWSSKRCEERKHPICEKCCACLLCEFQECCTQKEVDDAVAVPPLPEADR